jgi:imidazolonepropionase-like amidohydrolase
MNITTRMAFVAGVMCAAGVGISGQAPQMLKPGASVYVIQGAKINTLVGAPIEKGTIVIENGRIKAVGANLPAPAGAEVLKADGLEVYPGLFDSVSELGLTDAAAR